MTVPSPCRNTAPAMSGSEDTAATPMLVSTL
jgi:hypothetical protein